MTEAALRRSAILETRIPPESQAEFDTMFREHNAAVRRHLVYLTGDPAIAEDLSQDAFGKLYERLGDRGAARLDNPRAWLLTVASHLAYNYFRTESRRVARESDAPLDSEVDVDAVLDVRHALEALAPRDRTALLLRHSGFTYAEIAEAIDVAPGSVGTTLARAQRRFADAYEGACSADEKE